MMQKSKTYLGEIEIDETVRKSLVVVLAFH